MLIKRGPAIFFLPLLLVWAGAPCCAEDAPLRTIGESATAASLFEMGGHVMWPIFAVGIAGLVLIVERLVNLRRSRHAPENFQKDVVKVVDTRGVDAALALCLEKSTSLSRVLYCALLRQGSPRQELERAAIDECQRVLYDLQRNTRPIGVMCLLSFALGLLGACVNFMNSLDDAALADASMRFGLLATGGVRALLPVIFGILTGIVLGVMYFHLRGRARDVARDVEELGIEAVVSLDRKARQSIRLIEDIEEQIDTQDMPGIKPPDLDKEFEDSRESSGLKTSITTHHGLAAAAAAAASSPATPAAPPPPAPTSTPLPQNAPKT